MKARGFKTKKTRTYLAVRKNKGESLYSNARKRVDKKFKRK